MSAPTPIPDHLLTYCERAGSATLWAEPLNAISNLAFLWFAWKAGQLVREMNYRSFRQVGDIWMLTIAMGAIGIGSGLWHTHAARGWTVVLDVVPIYFFINVCVISLFMRLLHFNWLQAVGVWVAFTAVSVAAEVFLPRGMLNGSIMYAPSWAMLGIAALLLRHRQSPNVAALWLAIKLFSVALFFRTIDQMACDFIPFGTHFLWHLLNAALLFHLVRVLAENHQQNRRETSVLAGQARQGENGGPGDRRQ